MNHKRVSHTEKVLPSEVTAKKRFGTMIVNDKADGQSPTVKPYQPDTAIAVRRDMMAANINKAPYPSYNSYTLHDQNGIVVEHGEKVAANE